MAGQSILYAVCTDSPYMLWLQIHHSHDLMCTERMVWKLLALSRMATTSSSIPVYVGLHLLIL
jgi:hypothetical protein